MHSGSRAFPADNRRHQQNSLRQAPTWFLTHHSIFMQNLHPYMSGFHKHFTCELIMLILIHQIQIHTKSEGHFVLPFILFKDVCVLRWNTNISVLLNKTHQKYFKISDYSLKTIFLPVYLNNVNLMCCQDQICYIYMCIYISYI